MSSEYTSNETTPLRRTEQVDRGETNNISARTSVENLSTSSPVTLNYKNNNNESLQLSAFTNSLQPPPSTTLTVTDDQYPFGDSIKKMDSNQRTLLRIVIDFIVLLCVGFPILFFYLWGEPYKRGFFCDDESLKHPFHDSTVKNWMLYLIGLVLPIVIIVATEFVKNNCAFGSLTPIPPRYRIFDWGIPPLCVHLYKQIGVFGFGAAISQLMTDIAKYTIGRFRPHFINLCDPVLPDGTDCSSLANYGKYIEDFVCRSDPSNPRLLKEMRLSFPSGHSSFSSYTMVYCAIYLQSRMTWKGSKLFKHFLQFVLVMLAWFTALSRISNYKHHWSDVLSGSLIGSLVALVVANFVSDLLDNRHRRTSLPVTRQEMTTVTPNQNCNPVRI